MTIDIGVIYRDAGFQPVLTQTGDIKVVENLNSVKQAIYTIMNTRRGTRLFEPDFGMDIERYLFEFHDGQTKSDLKIEVVDSINRFEPRATVLDVIIKDLDNIVGYSIDVTYKLNEVNATDSIVVNLQRL